MAPTSQAQLFRRQYPSDNGNDCYLFCGDATSHYAITAAVIVGILLIIFGARAHAQHRLRTGKPLLLYHKWMVRSTPPPNPNSFHTSSTGTNAFPPTPGPWGGRHTMPQDHHPTDYELEGWQYPPPPPAYGEANVEGNVGEVYQAPMYPPPVYESKGTASKTVATVTQTDAGAGAGAGAGQGSSRVSQVEERERQQERQRLEVEDRERQQAAEYARAHDTARP